MKPSTPIYALQCVAATMCAITLVKQLSLPSGQINAAMVMILLVLIALNGYNAGKETIRRFRSTDE